MYEIRYHPAVIRRDFKKLDRSTCEKILRNIQKKLTSAPSDYGKPLRFSLKGYWRLRVEDLRIIYEIAPDKPLVTIWLVDQRKDDEAYLEFLKRLGT